MTEYESPTITEIASVDLVVALKKQIDDLQAANTRLLEERRAVDMHYNVEHFHRAMGIPVRHEPGVPDEARVRLKLRLIAEEFFELLRAALVDEELLGDAEKLVATSVSDDDVSVDLPEFADALADLDYVVEGARLEFGIDGRPIARLVHAANMAKVGGEVREDGKIMKPADWKPSDIAGELKKQGMRIEGTGEMR